MDIGVSCDPINAYNHGRTMNKVLEYMAFGRPQVMFDLKEGRASAGDAAIYVGESTSIALAQALARLLDDPAERSQMGGLGAKRLREEPGWDHSVSQLHFAYARATR